MTPNVHFTNKNRTEGRTPERTAFPLTTWSDAIRVSLPQSPESFTLDAWVRIDQLDPTSNSLLMSVGKSRGGVIWQLTNNGKVQFGVRESARKVTMYESPVVLTDDLLGQWVRLGVVVDSSRNTITQYLDGSVIFSAKKAHSATISLREFDLGNWTPNTKSGARSIRNLNGVFDSFEMYDKSYAKVPAK